MRYEYFPNDIKRYAQYLRHDAARDMLVWDSARGQDVLIVQTPYGEDAAEHMEAVCESLSRMTRLPDQYTKISGGLWIIALSAINQIHGGCPLHSRASSYTVFSYLVEDDLCRIFAPGERSYAQVDISLDVEIDIVREFTEKTVLRGLFPFPRRVRVPTGLYRIKFPPELSDMGDSYTDGALQCRVGDFQSPITKRMITAETVFVEAGDWPVIESQNNGLNVRKLNYIDF